MTRRKLGGTWWRIGYGDPGRTRSGVCDYDQREIIVRRGLTKAESVGTAIHEAIHQAAPDLTEDATERIELAAMKVLEALHLLPTED